MLSVAGLKDGHKLLLEGVAGLDVAGGNVPKN